MRYLSTNDLLDIGIDWHQVIKVIRESVHTMNSRDFAQPQKPYLRYKNPKNRIIAMPAYLGGPVHVAGIKWIASFPGNPQKGLQRAHSVTILNDADCGSPFCIVNSALISIIRTAAVTGLVMEEYLGGQPDVTGLRVGICGMGPIGRHHVQMLEAIAGPRIAAYFLYDVKPVDLGGFSPRLADKIQICSGWEQAFDEANVFVTCTVADGPYIDRKPLPGSLQLNISLRDYQPSFLRYADRIIVDDWNEVCRENTDIEVMHKTSNLQESDCSSLVEVVCGQTLRNRQPHEVIFFNPMGMGVFDIAMCTYYFNEAVKRNNGVELCSQ